jgi:signal transduction histidine kinase/pSer/pThr/pTyr-binding forkhead associated (FHA) protein
MPKLHIKGPSGHTEELSLVKSKYTVGRSPGNNIVLEDSDVSRRHCLLRFHGQGYDVEDLASRNGTYLNGKRIEKATLGNGDQLQIGHHLLSYLASSVPEHARAPVLSHTIDESYETLMSQLAIPLHKAPGEGGAPEAMSRKAKGSKTFHLLLDLSNALSSERSVEDVCRKAAGILLELTEAERAVIYLLQEDQETLSEMTSCAREGSAASERPAILSRTIADRILSERRGIVTSDAVADERFAYGLSVAAAGLRSVACSPLLGKGGNLGILYIENNTAVGAFGHEDLQLLCGIASQIGLAIENAKFYEALKRTNENLENIVEERTAALAQTQLKLYQAEKIASLSRLVAGVAHEINNPLGALKSNLDLLTTMSARLISGSAGSADAKEHLSSFAELSRISIAACTRIASVVRALNSFAHLDEAAYKLADINEGLKTSVRLLDPALIQNVDIKFKLAEIPQIPCFPTLLNEAFMNLLVNACEAIEGSGEVTVETRREGDNIIIMVQDSGRGIPQEHLRTIFDPGFTTKGKGVGIGLGLPVVYSVIREHQGSVDVKSELNQGSLFTIHLPIK